MPKINLKALSKQEIEAFIHKAGLPRFRAKQLQSWMYEKYAQSIQDITEFSKELRDDLSYQAYISNLIVLNRQLSEDGTEKFLFGLEDGETIESVLIPDKDRLTLCISSQVGCAMGCSFCLTGKSGFTRNLKAYEIVDQVIAVMRIRNSLCEANISGVRQITNIVLMGMGEPLSNFDEVVEALWRIIEFVKISKRRITLSTSGIAPKLLELTDRAPHINIAISLNATTDRIRDNLMPLNKKYPLRLLLNACRKLSLDNRRRITFEYILIEGVNDSPEDAVRLGKLLKGISCKVNLIPLNQHVMSELRRPSEESIACFQQILLKSNITALIRKSKGNDILAACGQLRGKYAKS